MSTDAKNKERNSFLLKLLNKVLRNIWNVLRGFDPLLLFFMNEIKIVSYSFSPSVIEYNSNGNF